VSVSASACGASWIVSSQDRAEENMISSSTTALEDADSTIALVNWRNVMSRYSSARTPRA
jgi:hypothetical protein